MRSDWRDRLSVLPRLEDPDRIWHRVEQGPTGDGVPTTPGRGQRIAAGVVALSVFAGAAVFAFAAFRGAEPATVTDPDTAVLTLTAGVKPEASLSLGDESVAGVADTDSSCGFDETNGALACEPVTGEEFHPGESLRIPLGTPFVLVDDGAAVALALTPGSEPTSPLPTSVEALRQAEPGPYVLTTGARWGDGQLSVFHFALEIVQDASIQPPIDEVAAVSIQRDPLRVVLTYAGQQQKGVIRDTWKPSGDPYDSRPACDDGTLGSTLLVVPPSTRFTVEGDRLDGWTVFPQPDSDPTHLPGGSGPLEWTFRGEWPDREFDACFDLFVGEPGVTVPVPDVVDLLDQGAYRALGESGLLWDVVLEDTPDEKQWRVIGTDPPVGAELEPNSVVHLVVSTRIIPPPEFAIGNAEWACPAEDRIPFGGHHLRLDIGGSAYITANLGGAEPGDEVVPAMVIDGSPSWDVWHWVRDGMVVAIVDYGSLDGVACRGSGVAGV